MARLRIWFGLIVALGLVAIVPALTASASARLLDATLTITSPRVHPGNPVTAQLTVDRKVPPATCSALLDGGLIGNVTCTQRYEPISPTTGPTTDSATRTIFELTVTIPVTTAPGQHVLLVRADKESARGVFQVTYPVVPNVLGLLYTRAAEVARAAGLTLCAGPKGLVVAQEPQPGAQLAPTVCLAVTTKPAATVPDVRGKDLATARSLVTSNNLVLAEPASTAGVVGTQTPAPQTIVLAGSRVSVTMKAAGTLVRVPDLVGHPVGDAQKLLDAVGLRLRNGGSNPQRLVATQDPTSGAGVARGRAVTVTLRPGTVVVPDLRGETPDQARVALAGAGLTLGDLPPDAEKAGRIETQSPPAGAAVSPGSTVTVTLAGAGIWPVVLRIGGTGGTFVLGLAAGLVVARIRRPTDGHPDDPGPVVRLRPRVDTGLDVRLVDLDESPSNGRHLDVHLETHDDEPIDPILLEVSS